MNFDVPTIVAFLYPFLFALMIIEYLNAKHLYNPKEAGSSLIIAIVVSLVSYFLLLLVTMEFSYEDYHVVRNLLFSSGGR